MPSIPSQDVKVIHSMDNFLNISENWIYPQIVGVPGVQTKVLCQATLNSEHFPFEPSRFCFSPPPKAKWMGCARGLYRAARAFGWWDFAAAIEQRRWRPDVIHAHFGPRGCIGVSFKRAVGARALITSFYGADAWMLPKQHPEFLKSYPRLFSAGDLFLVEGAAMRERLIALGCPQEKIRIQHIGVNLSALPFERRAIRPTWKVVMVARYCEKKGMPDGLRACALANSRGGSVEVTIIGGAKRGDEAGERIERELHEIAATPELAGRVHFAGFLSPEKMRATLRQCDVFLCPSRHASTGDAEGGSPVVLTESMASGLLCVGTRHCDIPEVILHQRTGYLVDEGNVEALAGILVNLDNAAAEITALREAGRRHVEDHFCLEKQQQLLSAIYHEALGAAHAPYDFDHVPGHTTTQHPTAGLS